MTRETGHPVSSLPDCEGNPVTANPEAARTRALSLLEAADFLRNAHFRDGMTVQEIGAALRRTADDTDPMVGSLARDGFGLDEIAVMLAAPACASAVPDPNTGPGWYEVINPRNATTNIVYVHEDGTLYLPEGDDLTSDEFAFTAVRGNVHRLVRADDEEARP